jgi:hypothetical protein
MSGSVTKVRPNSRKPRLVEKSTGEEYLHKIAWVVVKRQIAHAEANPKGRPHDYLVAMVFAFHCMEGYLNFIGEKIAPELWADEKTAFRDTGLTGKLTAICERCGIHVPKKGTLSELKTLRDRMAHPKIYKTSKTVEFAEDNPPPLFAKSYLSSLVSHQKALKARDDVKRIADEIHGAAVSRFPHAALGHDALEGIFSMRSSSTRLSDLP